MDRDKQIEIEIEAIGDFPDNSLYSHSFSHALLHFISLDRACKYLDEGYFGIYPIDTVTTKHHKVIVTTCTYIIDVGLEHFVTLREPQ